MSKEEHIFPNANILISVCMLTYNHENYISQAIEAVLKQQGNFNLELIIAEDCSTDKTRLICEEYAAQYPGIIRLLAAEANMGVSKNFMRALKACNGKYIALCEGDDYWTDVQKSQQQLIILEKEKNISMVSANADYLFENAVNNVNTSVTNKFNGFVYYGLDGLVDSWKCQTLTVMFRKEYLDFEKLNCYAKLYDTMLFYELLQKGSGYYLGKTVGVYRHHPGGYWHGKNETQKKKFVIAQFYEIWKRNKADIKIKNKLSECITGFLRESNLFTTNEKRYYVNLIFKYCRVTKNYKYLKLLFTNHVRYLRNR